MKVHRVEWGGVGIRGGAKFFTDIENYEKLSGTAQSLCPKPYMYCKSIITPPKRAFEKTNPEKGVGVDPKWWRSAGTKHWIRVAEKLEKGSGVRP